MGAGPTCWVLDHPAHLQLFNSFIENGSPVDIIVVTKRDEIDAMISSTNNPLPSRHLLRVPRPVGRKIIPLQREFRAFRRLRKVTSVLKRRNITGKPIEKIITKGAPIELLAAKKAKIARRIYLTDTEVNHLAHRHALSSATEVILSANWREHLDGGFLAACKQQGIIVHQLEGELPHVYLTQPSASRKAKEEGIPTIFHRALLGGGIHDKDELVSATPMISDLGMDVLTTTEGQPSNDPWGLPRHITEYDGVLSESVTLAHEAVCQGIPTLLVSKAQRGFLDPYLGSGLLFRLDSTTKGPSLTQEVSAWREAVQMRRRGSDIAVGWSNCSEELSRILS
ncbi:MAG: hypothetical protein CMO20_02635 [Thermoplasmata archaeon]|nr:hypothetical protein [Thermoplasmata archaeon]